MCDFISWIEKNGRLWYLTSADLSSKRGKKYREYNPNPDDFPGHGAIRWFYGLTGGTDHEQTDFSSPDNFPLEIAAAIKEGKFCRWFGGPPRGLLLSPLWKAYEEQEAQLWKAYEEQEAQPWKAYDEQETPLWKAYKEQGAQLRKAYEEQEAQLWKAYEEQEAPLRKAYEEHSRNLNIGAWHLFLRKENRAEAWK